MLDVCDGKSYAAPGDADDECSDLEKFAPGLRTTRRQTADKERIAL